MVGRRVVLFGEMAAGADFVRGEDGRFLVMELELIEPSMYLRMNKEAPQRFAEAFDNYVSIVSGGNKKCSEIS